MEDDLILKKLTLDHPDFPAVEKLLEEAFPENERPLTMAQMLEASEQMPGPLKFELLGIYSDEVPDDFAGFFATINGCPFVYLLFFATCSEKRSKGLGSKAIQALRGHCGDTPLLFVYESIYEESNNAEQRERRRSFYLKNGFYETGWFVKDLGIEYIVASSQEEVSREMLELLMDAMLASAPSGTPAPELFRRDG